jgi:hypothetical protein
MYLWSTQVERRLRQISGSGIAIYSRHNVGERQALCPSYLLTDLLTELYLASLTADIRAGSGREP